MGMFKVAAIPVVKTVPQNRTIPSGSALFTRLNVQPGFSDKMSHRFITIGTNSQAKNSPLATLSIVFSRPKEGLGATALIQDQLVQYPCSKSSLYVDASEACNDLRFVLGNQGVGTGLANRQWSVKVRKLKFKLRERGNCKICYTAIDVIDVSVNGLEEVGLIFMDTKCCGYTPVGLPEMGFDCIVIPGLRKSVAPSTLVGDSVCGNGAGLPSANHSTFASGVIVLRQKQNWGFWGFGWCILKIRTDVDGGKEED
ncbi:hypothetical protein TCAL_13399 [Tigriopus californicus]|uniref:Uncharacterized protein n=1 Tax=Tigriopus californicus TaxID=6832 RepID=A0A553PN34_TIGCA|nr:hypothetical protein TCAL_13399 [Tigriopus californicus]